MIVRLTAPLAPLAARLRSGSRALRAQPRQRQIGAYGGALLGLAVFAVCNGGAPVRQLDQVAQSWVVPIAVEANGAAHAASQWATSQWLDGIRAVPWRPERPAVEPAPSRHTVETLEDRLAAAGFELEGIRTGQAEVPRVFLAALPPDMPGVTETDKRKRMFIATLLPLVLKSNEKIMADRERLLRVADRIDLGLALKPADDEWLGEVAELYGVERADLAELKRRIDIVPPSLALAQAAEESGWGTSRYALVGNAVFGQYTTSDKGNMVPAERGEGQTHAIRAFDALGMSVDGYMRNLNSHFAYGEFRKKRERYRAEDRELDPKGLLQTLTRYSARGQDYIRTIATIMRVNQLDHFDRARLQWQQASLD